MVKTYELCLSIPGYFQFEFEVKIWLDQLLHIWCFYTFCWGALLLCHSANFELHLFFLNLLKCMCIVLKFLFHFAL